MLPVSFRDIMIRESNGNSQGRVMWKWWDFHYEDEDCVDERSWWLIWMALCKQHGIQVNKYAEWIISGLIAGGVVKMFRIEEKDGDTYIYSVVNKKLLCVLRDNRFATKVSIDIENRSSSCLS